MRTGLLTHFQLHSPLSLPQMELTRLAQLPAELYQRVVMYRYSRDRVLRLSYQDRVFDLTVAEVDWSLTVKLNADVVVGMLRHWGLHRTVNGWEYRSPADTLSTAQMSLIKAGLVSVVEMDYSLMAALMTLVEIHQQES